MAVNVIKGFEICLCVPPLSRHNVDTKGSSYLLRVTQSKQIIYSSHPSFSLSPHTFSPIHWHTCFSWFKHISLVSTKGLGVAKLWRKPSSYVSVGFMLVCLAIKPTVCWCTMALRAPICSDSPLRTCRNSHWQSSKCAGLWHVVQLFQATINFLNIDIFLSRKYTLAGGIPCHQWNIYIDGLCQNPIMTYSTLTTSHVLYHILLSGSIISVRIFPVAILNYSDVCCCKVLLWCVLSCANHIDEWKLKVRLADLAEFILLLFVLSRFKDSVKHFPVKWNGRQYTFGLATFDSFTDFKQHFDSRPMLKTGGE